MYDEVNLPFDHIEKDQVEGEELYRALSSQEVQEALDDYSLALESDEGQHVLRAYKPFFEDAEEDYMVRSLGIEAEIRPENEYSHLRLRVSAPNEELYEQVLDDLEDLERGLEQYFASEAPSAYESGPMTGCSSTD
jgi:hypothetical protein